MNPSFPHVAIGPRGGSVLFGSFPVTCGALDLIRFGARLTSRRLSATRAVGWLATLGSLGRRLAKHEFVDLPAPIARKGLDNLNGSRHLVVG